MLLAILLMIVFAGAMIMRPGRALGAAVTVAVVTAVLTEGAEIAPRVNLIVGVALGLMVLLRRGAPNVIAKPRSQRMPERPVEAAIARLQGEVGLLSRSRLEAIRRRVALIRPDDDPGDPSSLHTMLRIRLERHAPELIDTALQDLPRASRPRRRALIGEVLGEIETLLDNIDASDPQVTARADRRAALRQHLRSGTGSDPLD